MARTLQPEDRIAHYRVISPLGAGGMGEVYLAHDESLERSVALKVLPSHLVQNQERVRRFITEAKSASSLSHPHIVTIHEIGHDRVQSGDSDEEGEPVHYMSMELIQGTTFQDEIHRAKTDVRTLLGYLVQAAEGLAKAHASGIVHRDLKPGNIMVTRDGYAKVLDFGLAKLTERGGDGDTTMAATRLAGQTSEGVVLGTVGYMSPEQVRGQIVDHRSDVFSFGCILYEAVTRTRPFQADSDVETMHQILHQQPAAVEEVSPEIPGAVRRLIKRCLAKNPERRAHSMKDIALELADIVEEFETLPHSGSSAVSAVLGPDQRRGLPAAAIVAIVAFGILGLGFGAWSLLRDGGGAARGRQPFQTMSMSSVVSAEGVGSPVLSADGRYLAFVSGRGSVRELWVRQVATGSQVKVVGPESGIRNLSFSPDGNYVYYGMRDPDTPNYTAIYSVPSLGGASRKRLFDVDTAISISPDGKRACFRRGLPQDGKDRLVVADLQDGGETILAEIETGEIVTPPVWSRDGASIAWAYSRAEGGFHTALEIYPADGGAPSRRRIAEGFAVMELQWLAGDESLVCVGTVAAFGWPQLYSLDIRTGARERITNDLSRYSDLSVGDQGAVIAAVRTTEGSNVWTVPVDGPEPPRQITFTGAAQMVFNLHSTPDGGILFELKSGDSPRIARMAADGSDRTVLTPEGVASFMLRTGGDRVVFERLSEDFTPHIWLLDPASGQSHRFTSGPGEFIEAVSPDGERVLYARTDEGGSLWTAPLDGGDPVRIGHAASGTMRPGFSPDGRRVMYAKLQELRGRWVTHFLVVPADGGDVEQTIPPPRPGMFNVQWTPDGAGLSYGVRGEAEGANVYRVEIDGSGDRALTDFDEGWIDWYVWSPDGRHLIMDRHAGSVVGLWIQPFEDGRPAGPARELASFPGGFLSDLTWLRGQDRIAFRHGTAARDVVVIRDFD